MCCDTCTGVRLKEGRIVPADLVVDASGSNTRISKWLELIGHPAPPTMLVDAGLQYTCRVYERTDDPRDWKVAAVADNPGNNRMSILMPIEHNKWQASATALQKPNFDWSERPS